MLEQRHLCSDYLTFFYIFLTLSLFFIFQLFLVINLKAGVFSESCNKFKVIFIIQEIL
jgi:hypothetical protein